MCTRGFVFRTCNYPDSGSNAIFRVSSVSRDARRISLNLPFFVLHKTTLPPLSTKYTFSPIQSYSHENGGTCPTKPRTQHMALDYQEILRCIEYHTARARASPGTEILGRGSSALERVSEMVCRWMRDSYFTQSESLPILLYSMQMLLSNQRISLLTGSKVTGTPNPVEGKYKFSPFSVLIVTFFDVS